MSYNNFRYKPKKRYKHKRILVLIIIIILVISGAFIYNKFKNKPIVVDSVDVPTPTPVIEISPSPTVTPNEVPVGGTYENPITPTASIEPTPVSSTEIDLLKVVRRNDGVKTAYLTFDDGPTKSITPQILDILRRYNVKATFFMVGTLIESNPDMARRVHEEGHLLGNHSYAHNYSELYATSEGFISEINKTQDLIEQITDDENYYKVFRYPGGSYNAGTWGAKKQEYKSNLSDMGFHHCDWNSLNGDAEGGKKNAEQLLQGVITSAEGKEDIVILMHDAATKQATADSLAKVIEHLMSQGYEFKRLDQ